MESFCTLPKIKTPRGAQIIYIIQCKQFNSRNKIILSGYSLNFRRLLRVVCWEEKTTRSNRMNFRLQTSWLDRNDPLSYPASSFPLTSGRETAQASMRSKGRRLEVRDWKRSIMDAKSEPKRACAKWIPADQMLCCIVSSPGFIRTYMRVSMGLTDRRKTAKNLVDSRKNWKILTVSRK